MNTLFTPYRNILFLLFVVLFIVSCKESSIIGRWQNRDYKAYRKLIKNDSSSIGNLTIAADATFFIQGDGKKNIDTIPGWHTGGDFSGTWSISNKKLVLNYDPALDPWGITFIIFRLTKRKLILASPPGKKGKYKIK